MIRPDIELGHDAYATYSSLPHSLREIGRTLSQVDHWEWNLNMLILSRRESECICLGDDIVLTIVRVNGDKVRIGIEAPANVKILRNELEKLRKLPEAPEAEGVSQRKTA